MKRSVNIKNHLVAIFMLLLFGAYYVNVNCFSHSHIVNGVTIVHSHVHKSSHHDSESGGHTSAEVNLIATVYAQFLTTGMALQDVPANYSFVTNILNCQQDSEVQSIHLSCPSLRAPPAEKA